MTIDVDGEELAVTPRGKIRAEHHIVEEGRPILDNEYIEQKAQEKKVVVSAESNYS